jgi:hypothetical protein
VGAAVLFEYDDSGFVDENLLDLAIDEAPGACDLSDEMHFLGLVGGFYSLCRVRHKNIKPDFVRAEQSIGRA